MPARTIPGTDKIFFSNPNTGDRVIDLKNYPDLDDTLKNEDIVVVGDWEDYSGSGTKPAQAVMLQGISNNETPSTAAILAGNEVDIIVTDRGNRASTTRQRSKLVYIE